VNVTQVARPFLTRTIAGIAAIALVLGGSLAGASAASAEDAAAVAAAPVVTITPNADVDPAVQNTFTIAGTGFTGAGAANGTYVNVGSTAAWTPGTVPDASRFVKSGWVPSSGIVNGAFTTTLVVPANSMDRSLSYGVATFAAHGLSITDRTLDTFTPFSFTAEAPPAPVVTATATTLTAPTTAVVDAAVTLTASVAPATAGSVQFFDGATSLATVAVASGAANTQTSFASAAAHSLTAVFTPADTALFSGSTSAAVSVAVAAAPVVVTPKVTVSKTALSSAGQTVTVTGSGFTPNAPATNATRAPLTGFGGVYVTFGKFAEVWKPSAGATSTARKTDSTTLKWFVNEADVALVGGAARGGVAINPDGTFSVDLLLKPGFSGEPETGNYGIYTYPGGGATYAPFEIYTPITFSTPVTPKVTVTPDANVDPTVANTFTITGTGFTGAGAANGTYVNIGSVDAWTPGTVPDASKFVKSGWVMPRSIVDGAFTTTLVVPANSLDRSVKYGVATFAAHGLSVTDRTLDTFTPFALKALVAPKVTVTPSTDVDPTVANTFTITGTGFTGAGAANGTYVNVGSVDAWTPGTVPDASKFVASGWVMPRSIVDGAFTATLVVPANTLDRSVKYGVATFAAHGLSITDRTLDTFTPFTLKALVAAPTATTLTATPAAITVGQSTTLTAQVAPGTAGSYTFSLGDAVIGTATASAAGAGSYTVENLPVGAQLLTARFTPASNTFEASTGTVTVQVAAATPVTPPVVAPPAVGAGSLTWGVKQSFRDYVSGSIAKGAITTSGVSTSGGAFVFSQASAGTFDRATGTGTSAYSGSVRFTGHNGILDVTLANPVVRVDSATSGTLLVTTGSRQIAFATLNLSAGSLSTPNNTVSYSGVPATLTAEGVAVFALNGSGFYPAGTPLDPVSFVIGAPSVSASTGSATVASFASVTRTPAKTVPAVTGLAVSTADGSPLVEGGEVTITADGFQPNEKNILVVIYSDPVVLASNATADARGTVTWTGRLPAGLTGTHTLTLQGSVDRGVEVTIAAKAATTAVAGCVVYDATLTWGFKESFRSYISGSIAKGEWTVADGATYAVPNFGFSAGTGGYDPETGAGLLAFAGSIAFTGHGGLLNTTVSNPQLQLVDETSAILLLDISGTTQDGAAVDRAAVEFGSVDLTGAVATENGVVTITSAPAALTAAGSDAFGTYPEGEALDAISATFSVADDCAQPVEESDTPVTTMAEGEPDTAVAASETSEFGWILWAVLALLLIAAAVAVVLVVRRRAATRS